MQTLRKTSCIFLSDTALSIVVIFSSIAVKREPAALRCKFVKTYTHRARSPSSWPRPGLSSFGEEVICEATNGRLHVAASLMVFFFRIAGMSMGMRFS